jgi:uncharacterized membrane protein YvbJ
MAKCWNCGTENPEGATYCYRCGRALIGPGLDSKTMAQMSPGAGVSVNDELFRRVKAAQTYSLVSMILIILLWIFLLI